MDARKDDKSSITSDILTINFHENMNISDISNTYDKRESESTQQETIPKVRIFYPEGEQWETVNEASASYRTPVTKPTAHDNPRYSRYPCPGIQRGFMGLSGHRIKSIEQNFISLVPD